MISAYFEDEKQQMHCRKPPHCPHSDKSSPNCAIWVKGYRDRKTGPDCLLALFVCKTHGRAFTVYPFGYTPYARQLVWPVFMNGEVVFDKEPASVDFRRSYFAAAIDASLGIRWPESRDPDLIGDNEVFLGVFKTQKRFIQGLCTLLGMDSKTEDGRQGLIARILNVPALGIRDADQRIRDGPTYRKKGREIEDLLRIQKLPGQGLTQILGLGELTEFWGKPTIF